MAGGVAGFEDHGRKMDRTYRLQRHIYDLTRAWYLLGRDHLIKHLAPPPGAHVLEIGCGTGRNLIKAARSYRDARFYGLDISREMLATARANITRAGLAHRITLGLGDAAVFDARSVFSRTGFDAVILSYSLSMVPRWRKALANAAEATAPQGAVHVVDFGDLGRLPPVCRPVLYAWLGRFHVAPRAELFAEIAALARKRGGEVAAERLFGGYAWYGRMSGARAGVEKS